MNDNLLLVDHAYVINKKDELIRLIDFAKYLYEDEVKRMDRFTTAVRVYLVFMLSTFAVNIGVIKYLKSGDAYLSASPVPISVLVLIVIFSASLLFNAVSFLSLVLVIKGWETKRISTPENFYTQISGLKADVEYLKIMLLSYLKATEENIKVNNSKFKLLKLAMNLYFITASTMITGGACYVYL